MQNIKPNVKRKKASRDVQNIGIFAKVKHACAGIG